MLHLGWVIEVEIDHRVVLPAMVHSLVVIEASFTPFRLNTNGSVWKCHPCLFSCSLTQL